MFAQTAFKRFYQLSHLSNVKWTRLPIWSEGKRRRRDTVAAATVVAIRRTHEPEPDSWPPRRISNGCSTIESKDVKFLIPSDSVVIAPNAQLELPIGDTACGIASYDDRAAVSTASSAPVSTGFSGPGFFVETSFHRKAGAHYRT